MNLQLVNLLLFSEKRKNLLLLLEEKPRSIDEIFDTLQISRASMLPHIKKLTEEGLILQQDKTYSLSIMGHILVRKVSPLLDAASTFEDNGYYWSRRMLDSVPSSMLKRIGEIKESQLVEPGVAHGFDLFPNLVTHLTGSSKVLLLFSYFHPRIPSFSLELAKKGVQLQLILSTDSFGRFSGDFHDVGENILKIKNASIFLYLGKPLKIPALIAVSENTLLLGFFNKNGRFEGQYLLCFEPRALAWGRELFEYYKERSENVCSMDSSYTVHDNQRAL